MQLSLLQTLAWVTKWRSIPPTEHVYNQVTQGEQQKRHAAGSKDERHGPAMIDEPHTCQMERKLCMLYRNMKISQPHPPPVRCPFAQGRAWFPLFPFPF